jgi:hypothetical protein
MKVPVRIPPNFSVKVDDVAQARFNTGISTVQGGVASALGGGIDVTLLKPTGAVGSGSTISVTPVATLASDIVLSTPRDGLPKGARIQIAVCVASAS